MLFGLFRIRHNAFLLVLFFSVGFSSAFSKTSDRLIQNFNKSWRFSSVERGEASKVGFDDAGWRLLNLPHDWSIEGKFSKDNPATPGGGALPGGIGWYRKTFKLDNSFVEKQIFVEFDGIYMNSEVWINDHYLGRRPYGYISFGYELTPYIKLNGGENVIAVKVDNSKQPNSRWYSGSGIYRNVRLVAVNPVHIPQWGTHIVVSEIAKSFATVDVKTTLVNSSSKRSKINLQTSIVDSKGKVVAKNGIVKNISIDDTLEFPQRLKVANPKLWATDRPYMYKMLSEVWVDGVRVDSYTTPLGIRQFQFDPDKGFSLNGRSMKINGVCLHHDLGCLGAAVNTRALERQLQILKAMGCNGIRTSHNPPAPELLLLCDSLGFIVMDEAFDMWKKQKNPHDYHLYWDEWHKKDLIAQIKRDRNHPSVMIWSIGNEIPEQWGDSTGKQITRELAAIVRDLDSTRPITAANNEVGQGNNLIQSGALDLIGYNYNHSKFADFHKDYPGKKFIATETVSALQTRGSYDLPSDSVRIWPTRWDLPLEKGNADLSCSAYENCRTPWGSTHEETWKVMKKNEFLSGQFIWTGFDYLGEPTPYPWPARSSYFGVVDLAGFPKDVYYMYQSEWTNSTVLHLFPHWNWAPGQLVDVWAYYNNADEVELFLNGRSLGVKRKLNDDLHVMWRVPFEPGVLKAVSLKNGKVVKTDIRKTAGTPAKIVLQADRKTILADGKDLSFVSVSVQDKDGNECPNANNLVSFSIRGEGGIAGVDNGSPTYLESLKASSITAFHGKCLAVIHANGVKGTIILKAASVGLMDAEVQILAK